MAYNGRYLSFGHFTFDPFTFAVILLLARVVIGTTDAKIVIQPL